MVRGRPEEQTRAEVGMSNLGRAVDDCLSA